MWDEPSPLERPGAGIGALRRAEPTAPRAVRGDRALATLGDPGAEPTPIFHELTEDRTRPRRAYRDRDALAVPEPHPGSGPLPVQDPSGRRRGLAEVPTVPPPAVDGSSAAGLDESPEDELRRRAERRRRPRADEARGEGGRHAWREELRGGRHALRR
ncbi:hypothetical protein ACFPK1_01420 [Actinomycetospora rhizophila]|uniref:Uncharacterized protein n=1 Tax=Actinomycetospora rhizophila TaxID=1416876 RepID=A0ABV9Z9J4_9PSEU